MVEKNVFIGKIIYKKKKKTWNLKKKNLIFCWIILLENPALIHVL